MEAARLLNGTNANLVVVCNADGVMVGVITKTDVETSLLLLTRDIGVAR